MALLSTRAFFGGLPPALRPLLPPGLQRFRSVQRFSWLVQVYYDDPSLHYEVWHLGRERGKLEIGLHFESRERATNESMLAGFSRHMLEVKQLLGEQFEAEPWDRGWTKAYETWPLQPLDQGFLSSVARRLAKVIEVLHPIYQHVRG